MRILAINLGSSSLKFAVFNMASGEPCIEGLIEQPVSAEQGLAQMRQQLEKAGENHIDAIGHRIAHGGADYSSAARFDESVERNIERLAPLAPQHNALALCAVRAARSLWPELAQVAVFDTAFHSTMPPQATTYAIPQAWREAGLRRYGFHGLSHEYVMEAVARELEAPASELRIISCHLGNGASICAIDRGQSIDTSMGLTALAGLVMGSRCGDLDPGAFGFLSRSLGLRIEEIEHALYADSGLKALSRIGADLRQIESAAGAGQAPAQLAMQVYAYRARKYIGAYAAAMGGCDAVAFTGGVGEHSSGMRQRIVDGLQFLGIHLDPDLNEAAKPDRFAVLRIHGPQSRIKLLVVRAQEEWVIARAAFQLLSKPTGCESGSVFIPVAVSAHHVHLTSSAVEVLFGAGHRLKVLHPLSQPGFFAAEETVTIVGERGRIEHARVLGPCRPANQIEISRTEAIQLGVDAPLRLSGHTSDTPFATLVGPAGSLRTDGVIVAQRHIHLSPDDARRLGAADGDRIDVTLDSPRAAVLRNVALRVAEGAVLEMHIDTDEANAAGLRAGGEGVLERSCCLASPSSAEGASCTRQVASGSEKSRTDGVSCGVAPTDSNHHGAGNRGEGLRDDGVRAGAPVRERF